MSLMRIGETGVVNMGYYPSKRMVTEYTIEMNRLILEAHKFGFFIKISPSGWEVRRRNVVGFGGIYKCEDVTEANLENYKKFQAELIQCLTKILYQK